MIRTLIVDDQNLVREGIRILLEKAVDIEIIGDAQDGDEALNRIEDLQPEVVLLDINLPDIDGLALAHKIRDKFPEVKIIMLSSCEDESYIRRATELGARGYLLKNMSSQELEWSIKLVHQGYSTIRSELLEKQIPYSSTQTKVNLSSKPTKVSHRNIARPEENDLSTADRPQQKPRNLGSDDNIERLLAKNHVQPRSQPNFSNSNYRKSSARSHAFYAVKRSRLKRTLTSFEFQLLVFVVLLSLTFLVFVALS